MIKLTSDGFIEKAKDIHGDKYDYSKVEYTNSRGKVCIICQEHGEFWQCANSHLMGCGCPKCYDKIKRGKKRQHDTAWFINKSREIHGDKYDYSKTEYVNMRTKVCIICPKHGEFWQTPINHLSSNGCNKCGREKFAENHNKGTEKFIKDAILVHSDRYDYSKVEYTNARTPVCIICPEHGEFWQTPNYHLSGNGCPKCSESHLEREVRTVLENNRINYIYQCGKETLPWLKKQTFDFYLPDYNVAIECQGSQHFLQRDNDLFSHEKTVERDVNKFIKSNINHTPILYYSNLVFNRDISIYNDNNSFNDTEKLIEEINNRNKTYNVYEN